MRLRSTIVFWLALAAVSLSPRIASADVAAGRCGVAAPTAAQIRALGEIYRKGDLLRICSLQGTQTHYYVRRKPWLGTKHVCHMDEQQLFPGTANGQLILKETASPDDQAIDQRQYMLSSTAPCPAASDARYIRTSHVSEGMFLKAIDLWTRISDRDGRGFDAACNVVSATERSSEFYRDVEKLVKSGAAKLNFISLRDWGKPTVGAEQYRLGIAGLPKPFWGDSIKTEWMKGQLCITGVSGPVI